MIPPDISLEVSHLSPDVQLLADAIVNVTEKAEAYAAVLCLAIGDGREDIASLRRVTAAQLSSAREALTAARIRVRNNYRRLQAEWEEWKI